MTKLTTVAVILALGAAGCAGALPVAAPGGEPEEVPSAPRGSIDDYLDEHSSERFRERCLLRWAGSISFTERGEFNAGTRAGSSLAEPVELVVVERYPSKVRVVQEDAVQRLAYFVRRVDLLRVPAASTALSLRPDRPADPGAGARVAGGAALTVTAAWRDMRKVKGTVDRIDVEGWIPDAALAEVYVPEVFSEPKGDGFVEEGTTIVASPAGERIARLPPHEGGSSAAFRYVVTRLPGAPAGYEAIHLVLPQIEIRGLVPAAAFKPKEPSEGLERSIGGRHFETISSSTDISRARLAPGTPLYTRDAEERIGVVRKDMTIYDVGEAQKGKAFQRVVTDLSPHEFVKISVRFSDLLPW